MAETKKKQKETFVITIDDKELKLAVERPKQEHIAEAQKVFNKAYRDAIESRALTRGRMQVVLQEENSWNDEKQQEFDKLQKEISEAERRLPQGNAKLSELKAIALKIRENRIKLRNMLSIRNSADAMTADAQAENARFNKLVSLCTVYNETGKKFFATLDEYYERMEEPVAFEAASKLAAMLYNLDPNSEANLPENKFLKQWGLIDDKFRLINADKHLVDTEGRLIDEEGRFVDKQGNFVDRDGNPIDKEGNYIVEEIGPVLDDDGNPIEPPQ